MSPPTLVSMAQRACAKNAAGLQDIGDMSYDLVRPILKHIDNPEQLRNIEISSPHIADHDSELWKAFIARDIPQWKEKIMEPKNPRSWWKVYRKMVQEEDKLKEAQEQQLRAALTDINKKKESNQAIYVPKVLEGHREESNMFAFGVRNPNVNSNGQLKRPQLRNATTGKQILSALRKQSSAAAKQKGLVHAQTLPGKVMVPSAKSQITRAPAAMVRDYAKPVPNALARPQAPASGQASRPTPNIFAPRRAPTPQQKAADEVVRAEQEKREERLRALTGGSAKATSATSLPSSAPQPAATSFQSPKANTTSPPAPALRPATPILQPPRNIALSPPKPVFSSPARPIAELSATADARKGLSPSPGPLATPQMRKRPAQPVNIFMPSKKRKI